MKYGLSLLCSFLLLPTLFAIDVKLPDKVTGEVADFVVVKADTTGKVVKWVVLDVGLRLFPTDLLKDTHAAVVNAAVAGKYRLLAYTSDATGPSDPAITTVVIGTPPPVPPAPVPPTPPEPVPVDDFFKALQAAYTADPDPAKVKHKEDLAELYLQADTLVNGARTAADLLTMLRTARQQLMPDSAFLPERQAVEKYLNSVLPTDPTTPLDATVKALLVREFKKVSNYLKAVK